MHLTSGDIESAWSREQLVLEHLTPTLQLPSAKTPAVDILQGLVQSVQRTLRCKSS
jgi:hypothetical protein